MNNSHRNKLVNDYRGNYSGGTTYSRRDSMRDKLDRSYAEEQIPHERTEAQLNEIWRSCMFPFPADQYKQKSDPK